MSDRGAARTEDLQRSATACRGGGGSGPGNIPQETGEALPLPPPGTPARLPCGAHDSSNYIINGTMSCLLRVRA